MMLDFNEYVDYYHEFLDIKGNKKVSLNPKRSDKRRKKALDQERDTQRKLKRTLRSDM